MDNSSNQPSTCRGCAFIPGTVLLEKGSAGITCCSSTCANRKGPQGKLRARRKNVRLLSVLAVALRGLHVLVLDVDLLRSVRRTRENHVDLDGLPDLDGSNVRAPSANLFYFRVGIAMAAAPRAVLRRRICTAFRAIPFRTLLCSPAPGSISLSSLFSMSVYSLSLCSMVDYLP